MDEMHTGKEGEIGSLVGTPGLSSALVSLDTGPIRALYTATDGALYAVSKDKVYVISSSYAATQIGTINSVKGPVSVVDNGIDVVLVDGTDGWYSALGSTTLTQITDAGWSGADQVTLLDGYVIFNKPNTNQFYTSDLPNSITLNALNFASKRSPDKIVGIIADHRNLWLFGSQTTEVWYDAANPTGVPFSAIEGGYIEVGCTAAFSIQQINNAVLFLGQDKNGSGIVYAMSGYQPQRISNHSVELAIQGYGDTSGAVAWSYQENGHQFYCLNFANANTTWVFDLTTGLWHERSFLDQGLYERHRAQCHAVFNNKHIVGDYENGSIYQLSSDIYSDFGNAIARRRRAPHISQGMVRNKFTSFQLDLEPGVGLDGTTQGTDPKAVLRFSDDGGHSWSNEKLTGIGLIGQTKHRAIWRRLGQARDCVFETTITDPVKVVLIGAEIGVEGGLS